MGWLVFALCYLVAVTLFLTISILSSDHGVWYPLHYIPVCLLWLWALVVFATDRVVTRGKQ